MVVLDCLRSQENAGIGLRNGIENEEHRGRFMAKSSWIALVTVETVQHSDVMLKCCLRDTLLCEAYAS
jgi:hypothetical protein